MKNKKLVIGIIAAAAFALVTVGITYAYWLVTRKQTNTNLFGTGCLNITLDAEDGDINLVNQFPMSDEDGMNLTPYTFTITNQCSTSVDYRVNLESLGNESADVIPEAIKVALDENTPRVLIDYVTSDVTIAGAYQSYILTAGTLTGTGTDGASVTYNLRIWLDSNAPLSERNKTYSSKISVSVGQGISSQGSTLASLILADAKDNGYLYTSTPDFSQATNEGEYGVYSAEDDLGTSYYFRGDVNNNYVAFGPDVYNSVYLASNIDSSFLESAFGASQAPAYESVFSSMAFPTEEACLSFPAKMGLDGLWNECVEQKSITNVYYSNTGIEEELDAIGFTSNESCVIGLQAMDSAVESCLEKEVVIGTQPGMYWRIVRINGDGTIRMIYAGESATKAGTSNYDNIGYYNYNPYNNDPKYVGYTYEDGANEVDSSIKSVIDQWYKANLEAEFGRYVVDSIFCNDRDIASVDGNTIYYAAHSRLYSNSNPELSCTRPDDKYTVSKSKGNGLLDYPIGLLTADELSLAGGIRHNNNDGNTYLKASNGFWTMTPYTYWGNGMSQAVMFSEYHSQLSIESTAGVGGSTVRPVINLKANILFEGNGTANNPYKIVQ